jgi:Uma2 family endonuclease
MSIRSHPLSYADLLIARDSSLDRLELIAGEIVVTPSPTPWHQFVLGRLHFLFMQTVRDLGVGLVFSSPLDVHLESDTVVQPDLFLILPDRRLVLRADRVEGAPSLAVEIISLSTRSLDQTTKRAMYARAGVPEYWLVESGLGTVTVYSDPAADGYRQEHVFKDIVRSVTITELSVDLAALFAPIPDA